MNDSNKLRWLADYFGKSGGHVDWSGMEKDLRRIAAKTEFADIAMEYADDLQNTISSIEEEFPATKRARMDRRMDLRKKFVDAANKIERAAE